MPAVYLALLFSVLAFVCSVVSFIFFRSYLKRRTSQKRILAEIQEEVNRILRSIDETTDRDISLIEEREKNLKSLLEDIDRRLKVYIRETEKRRDAEDAYAALLPKPQDRTVPRTQGENAYQALGKNRYRLGGQELPPAAESAPAASSAPIATPADAASAPEPTGSGLPDTAGENPNTAFPLPRFRVKPSPAETTPPPPVSEQIRELLRAGFAAPVIASRLGISIAEVEFAEALLERREN